MSIFQAEMTQHRAVLAKSCADGQMALISGQAPLGKATSLTGGQLDQISVPFGRLASAMYEFTA
jgi:hypothetical protein